MSNQDQLKPCPFCGAYGSTLYNVDIVVGPMTDYQHPAIFCDSCKATVYFEDSSSTGEDDAEDYNVLEKRLKDGWNGRVRT